ncbi:unnamed protein product [Leptidea sinapis]|uniref:Myosin VI cargo binding domain-containing protein n=1 Tax=Leptidea sinapis TaxID=189913 RepID=A0A5E4QDW5_9NEOP|nr:unnamed protein product [Leptidea sinapis]
MHTVCFLREEQERLRRLEAELRAAEEAKRQEMERIRQEEENRRLKAEMEARRKAEEAERTKQEEADRVAAFKLQQQLEEAARADQENRDRLEQERRDHEMAVRLARETNGHVEGSPPQLRSFPTMDSMNGENKLNRYRACRHEFHRRLKVYHAWKAKNARKSTMNEQERAPQSIMDAGVDDMQMCELSLDETGLTRKRGAEILEHEFEREWALHGGPPYRPTH